MIYYVDINRERRNTAGIKAPDDIAWLCAERGYTRVVIPYTLKKKNHFYQRVWLAGVLVFHWLRLFCLVREGDVVLYQHPFSGKRLAERAIPILRRRKKCRFVAVVHDLESLRGGIRGVIKQREGTDRLGDNQLLWQFDEVICHNEHMRQYLLSQGFHGERLVNLELFDYLTDAPMPCRTKGDTPSVAVAGTLSPGKSGYLRQISDPPQGRNPNLRVNLYGIGFEPRNAAPNLVYRGSFPPGELPAKLEGDFGLVWDGDSAETCGGNTGDYLRYNNPHKTSLYLAAGLPVIVWDQAAVADFVAEQGVGIPVPSLTGLEERIAAVSPEEYETLCRNARAVGERLRRGFYFYRAMDLCLEALKPKE